MHENSLLEDNMTIAYQTNQPPMSEMVWVKTYTLGPWIVAQSSPNRIETQL